MVVSRSLVRKAVVSNAVRGAARFGGRLVRIGGKLVRVGGKFVGGPVSTALSVGEGAYMAANYLGTLKRPHNNTVGSYNAKAVRKPKYPKRKGSQSSHKMIISRHNDMTVHNLGSVNVPGAKPFIKGASKSKFYYRNVNNIILGSDGVADQGRQRSDYPEVILTRQMLIGDTSTNRFDRNRVPDDFFKLNPYSARPVNDIYVNPPPESNVDSADVIGIKSVNSQISLLSMTTVAQIVDVYWLVSKYDTNDSPTDTWNSAMDVVRLGQNFASNSILPSNNFADSGAAATDNWGENPFKYATFRGLWRCLKHQKLVLQPGDQRHMKLSIGYNKVISRKTMEEIRETRCLQGLTVYPFVIAKAGLIGIKENVETPNAQEVSYGAPKVGVVHNSVYTFVGLQVNRFTTSRIYKGIIESTLGVKTEIDDNDNVTDVEIN